MSKNSPAGSTPVQAKVQGLHASCSKTLLASLAAEHNAKNAASFGFAADLDIWNQHLNGRKERVLYEFASREYLLSLLSNCQGQYRNAFKGLRLVLELVLQGAHLSTRLVTLNEWLGNESDTNWNAIVDQETGIFSRKFCRAFFPEAIDEAPTFASLATTLYREMSECIHGNIPKRIPLPDELAFHEATFLLWHDKAQALRLIANFALTIRYLVELDEEQKRGLEPVIMDQLGHIEVVRTFFGGPSTK